MTGHEKLLQNISNDIFVAWQKLGSVPQSLSEELNELEIIVNEIKELNQNKKISAAQIGKLKKAGEDFSHVIREQASLKSELKIKKEQKANVEKSISDFFIQLESKSEVPKRFSEFKDITLIDTISSINIITADNVEDELIDEYVDTHSHATPYHFSCWRNLISNVFKHQDMSIVAVNQNNQIQGFLPLIRLKSLLFGDFIVSMPYFNYGGPVANNYIIEKRLVDSAIEMARNNNLEHLEIRELNQRLGLESKQEKVSMVRKLPASKEIFSKEIGTKLRAQIKRSSTESPEIKFGKQELINDFYKVFATNMRDLGTPVYSKEFFYQVIEAWYDKSHIVVVYTNKKPVACALLLGYKEMLEIPWASALKKTNHQGINMFMYWNILNFAIENNYDFFDFGRSSKDSGTFKFKKQWGAEPFQNYWNYWLPDGEELPEINPNNTKYKMLINTWKKLPLFISNTIGPPIVKNIP